MSVHVLSVIALSSQALHAWAQDDSCRDGIQTMLEAWVGEGAWNLKRWSKRGNVPVMTKEQLDRRKLKY